MSYNRHDYPDLLGKRVETKFGKGTIKTMDFVDHESGTVWWIDRWGVKHDAEHVGEGYTDGLLYFWPNELINVEDEPEEPTK